MIIITKQGHKDTVDSIIDRIDLAVVGGGPQSLTLVNNLLQKKPRWRHRFIVIETSGNWLTQWQKQFQAFEIPHLRSPAVHHPDPNPYALRSFAEKRPEELFPPYDLPGTQLFKDFCDEVIQRRQLESKIHPGKVEKIIPSQGYHRLELVLSDGSIISARRVILANNYTQLQLPQWVSYQVRVNTYT
ncbi:FAD/NAD(P)-binding protein [Gloeocapsa sp. PCC 73106]|uniref:FAD/NAD(P)-binding protein n=1 Tax=Gloeocapsa sp. PCC 73106 TaxID=102232 RepID=UPI0002AC1541|nr:FAD/NAD(P)-binding protein [Gloeocapsa sp. PCC 73106]ELR97643.1 hypothetical protein GLO73106DRAFT_00014560 [Gloeocapsa sp. PCC 73106]